MPHPYFLQLDPSDVHGIWNALTGAFYHNVRRCILVWVQTGQPSSSPAFVLTVTQHHAILRAIVNLLSLPTLCALTIVTPHASPVLLHSLMAYRPKPSGMLTTLRIDPPMNAGLTRWWLLWFGSSLRHLALRLHDEDRAMLFLGEHIRMPVDPTTGSFRGMRLPVLQTLVLDLLGRELDLCVEMLSASLHTLSRLAVWVGKSDTERLGSLFRAVSRCKALVECRLGFGPVSALLPLSDWSALDPDADPPMRRVVLDVRCMFPVVSHDPTPPMHVFDALPRIQRLTVWYRCGNLVEGIKPQPGLCVDDHFDTHPQGSCFQDRAAERIVAEGDSLRVCALPMNADILSGLFPGPMDGMEEP